MKGSHHFQDGGRSQFAPCTGLRCGLLSRDPLASHVPSSGSLVQSCPDPAVYGVVQSGDHLGRTCMVKWFKLRPSGDDVEVCAAPTAFFRWALGLGVGPVAHDNLSCATADWRRGRRECLRHC